MTLRNLLFASLLVSTSCSSQPASESGQAVSQTTLYEGARLILGDGSAPLEDAAFLVQDGKFVSFGPKGRLEAPANSTRIDLTGKTVMPLMVNLHGHTGYTNPREGFEWNAAYYSRQSIIEDLNRYLYYGVGAIVATGLDQDLAFQVRDDQNQGKAEGAKYLTAGSGITAKGGWPAIYPPLKDAGIPYQASTEEEGRTFVRELAAEKVDIIKIWVDDRKGQIPSLKAEVYRAVIDEAHKHQLRVMAHVFYLRDAKDLVAAGVDGFAHSVRDLEVDEGLITSMKEKGVFLVATLTATQGGFIYAERPSWIGEPAMRETLPANIIARLVSDEFVNGYRNNPNLEKIRQEFQIAKTNLLKMIRVGVKVGFGTDSGTPSNLVGYTEHRELELMVDAGLTPLEAISAATRTSAEVLNLNDRGVLAPGRNADFLVLDANPLDNIANSRRIAKVYQKGMEIDRANLRSQWSGAALSSDAR